MPPGTLDCIYVGVSIKFQQAKMREKGNTFGIFSLLLLVNLKLEFKDFSRILCVKSHLKNKAREVSFSSSYFFLRFMSSLSFHILVSFNFLQLFYIFNSLGRFNDDSPRLKRVNRLIVKWLPPKFNFFRQGCRYVFAWFFLCVDLEHLSIKRTFNIRVTWDQVEV